VYSQRKIEYYHVKEDQIRFSLDQQPLQYNLAHLPEEILNWIEHHGFDLISLLDSNGRILYVSTSIEEMLGYHPSDIVDQFFLRYIPRRLHKDFLETFEMNTPYRQRFTIQLKSITEKNIWVDLVVKSIYIKSSKKTIYLALIKNISDKKEAEELLIRSEKMSVAGQLASGVVHEIRNPLTSLKGFIDLLQAGIERKEEYFKIMVDEIEKIEKISTELLYVSKPLTHDHSYQWLRPLISDVITLLNTQAVKKDIKIELFCADNIIIYADQSQMKQVFINLIKNSIEAMEKPGKITIMVKKLDDFCLIAITDEGPGIPKELIHKVKEPFFTTKKEGTGLGLMITHRIIDNHNGLLNIIPNYETGTTFEIRLPYYDPDSVNMQ